jgi:hypothetical protein
VQKRRRPEQERVEDDVEEIDEAQPLGCDSECSPGGVDMLFAGGDRNVADLPVGSAKGQRDIGLVGRKEQIAHCNVGGVVGVLGERFLSHRHDARQGQAIDCEDMVAGNDPCVLGLGPDRKAYGRCVVRRNGEAGPASEQQLRIIPRLGVAIIEADDRADDRKREHEQPEGGEQPIGQRVELGDDWRQPEAALQRIVGPQQGKLHPHQLQLPSRNDVIMSGAAAARNR